MFGSTKHLPNVWFTVWYWYYCMIQLTFTNSVITQTSTKSAYMSTIHLSELANKWNQWTHMTDQALVSNHHSVHFSHNQKNMDVWQFKKVYHMVLPEFYEKKTPAYWVSKVHQSAYWNQALTHWWSPEIAELRLERPKVLAQLPDPNVLRSLVIRESSPSHGRKLRIDSNKPWNLMGFHGI